MKIKKIEGENFKGHENLELNLADKKIQVFVGSRDYTFRSDHKDLY